MPNRLIKESSPYLLQHAHNPVDWFPWGNEALQKAKDTDKPILISIGYSACHWCHVMENESFTDTEVAELMNNNFICIKVDREEHPAVDDIYMEAVQAIAGNGGWPLNCFLTPEAKPFYGGTYFPPEDRYGKPGWKTVLNHIQALFQNERVKIEEQAERLTRHLGAEPGFLKLESGDEENISEKSFIQLAQKFDSLNGGFDDSPKFPASFALRFLLTFIPEGRTNEQAENMIQLSLNKMASGGFYDQIRGGFHRYTVDPAWQIPHFEKMLYDNACLMILYSEAYLRFKNESWKNIVLQTFEWIKEEMTEPETGACYAAIDADSEGMEGRFYIWSKQEIENILGAEAEIFCRIFDVSEAGNWEGHSILNRIEGMDSPLHPRASEWFQILLKHRNQRVRPGTDTKLICSWNALMLYAFIRAWQVFGDEGFKTFGLRLAEYLIAQTRKPGGLTHTQAGAPAVLEDYAFLIRALLEGAWTWQKYEWLNIAEELIQLTNKKYLDPGDGFYFSTVENESGMIVRKKEFYDNAMPSANAIMAENLWLSGRLTGKAEYRQRAGDMLMKIAPVARAYPRAFGHWLMLYQLFRGPQPDLVVPENANLFEKTDNSESFLPWLPGLIIYSSGGNTPFPQAKGKESAPENSYWHPCSMGSCIQPVQTRTQAYSEICTMY